MTLALSGKELERKTVADYYDAIYKGAATDKLERETAGLPGSYQEEVDAELEKIAAEKGLSQYQIAQAKKIMHDMDYDKKKHHLDYLKAHDVYINPKTGESRTVPPGENPPPGFTDRASTSKMTLSPGEQTKQREEAKSLVNLTGPELQTNILKNLETIYGSGETGQWSWMVTQASDPTSSPGDKVAAQEWLRDRQIEHAESMFTATSEFVTPTERSAGWEIRYYPAFESGGKQYPPGMYKVNPQSGDFITPPISGWQPKEF